MTWTNRELRAFPRFSFGKAAEFTLGELAGQAQVIDVSQGGCKLLPTVLEPLVGNRPRPGDTLRIDIGRYSLKARIAWLTPNCSAIGCQFETHLTAEGLSALIEQGRAAAE